MHGAVARGAELQVHGGSQKTLAAYLMRYSKRGVMGKRSGGPGVWNRKGRSQEGDWKGQTLPPPVSSHLQKIRGHCFVFLTLSQKQTPHSFYEERVWASSTQPHTHDLLSYFWDLHWGPSLNNPIIKDWMQVRVLDKHHQPNCANKCV